MALMQCPWLWTPDPYEFGPPFGLQGQHNHHMHHPLSYEMRAPRWAFGEEPCCEFCGAWRNVVCIVPPVHHDITEYTNSPVWTKACFNLA